MIKPGTLVYANSCDEVLGFCLVLQLVKTESIGALYKCYAHNRTIIYRYEEEISVIRTYTSSEI